MKKSVICLIIAAGMLASCDPIKEEKDFDINKVEQSALDGCFSFKQLDVDGNAAADGNYFTYVTSPATQVTVFNLLSDGSENMLARGTSGTFIIKPKRGSDPNQKFFIKVVNSDGTETIAERTVNVYVQQELDPEMRLLASDAYGSKIWKWDPTIGDGEVWGNMGYCGGKGSDVALTGNGKWWGCKTEEDFMEQLKHTHDGAYHNDGSLDAYMVFTDEGISTCYDASGNVIRTAPFSVSNYNPGDPDAWKVGDLVTSAILWPYEINSGGKIPGIYEIVYLTADKMCLVYPEKGNFGSLGNWGEATFWHFASNTDIEGMAIGYGKDAVKKWTWDYSIGDGEVWGNMGYCGGKGSEVGLTGSGKWWGCKAEEDFADQLKHTNDGALHGDESADAYFSLSNEGIITRVAGNGTVINTGTFEFDTSVASEWKVANLNTTAGTILWPFEINSKGRMPTTFEVVYLSNDKMCLVYPENGNFGALGNWGEATFWHFKAK